MSELRKHYPSYIGNYYGGIVVVSEGGKYYWLIENYNTDLDNLDEYEEISKELYNELMKHRNK